LKQKNDPVSIEMLLELCNMHLGNNDLLVVRDLTMILLSFAGFLRFDEVSSANTACVEISCPITEASNPTGITLVVCRLLQMYLKQERILSILFYQRHV
jgi:hypothetical protein